MTHEYAVIASHWFRSRGLKFQRFKVQSGDGHFSYATLPVNNPIPYGQNLYIWLSDEFWTGACGPTDQEIAEFYRGVAEPIIEEEQR